MPRFHSIRKCTCNVHICDKGCFLHIKNPGAYEGLITQLSSSQHRVCSLQECPSTQELQNSLRQAQKLLASHEASYLQSLRSLKRKISQLQNSTARMPSRPGDGNSSSFWREKKKSGSCNNTLIYSFSVSTQLPVPNWTLLSTGEN